MRSWKRDPRLRNHTPVALTSSGRMWKFRCTQLWYLCRSVGVRQRCGSPHGCSESSIPWDRLTSSHTGRTGSRGVRVYCCRVKRKGVVLWLSTAVGETWNSTGRRTVTHLSAKACFRRKNALLRSSRCIVEPPRRTSVSGQDMDYKGIQRQG